MEIAAAIVATLLAIIGVIGSVVPALPGPMAAYVGLLLLYFTGYDITTTNLVVCGVITVMVAIGDYLLAPLVAKKAGGSRSATIGSTLGVLVSVFVMPAAIFLAAFLGAFLGELIHNPDDKQKALKVGFYSFIGFVCGVFMQIAISLYVGFLIVKTIIVSLF